MIRIFAVYLGEIIIHCFHAALNSVFKVLSHEQENKRRRVKYQGVSNYDIGVGTVDGIQEKRTRFSLSHDQESIGKEIN